MAAEIVEISDGVEAVEEDAAAAKRREENRKKRERQKKKKAADKESAGNQADENVKDNDAANADCTAVARAESLDRWHTGKLPGGRAERRDCCAGAGAARGLGVFALNGLRQGEVVAAAPPALSCVFDASATTVCGFCFDSPKPDATTDHAVTLIAGEADESGNRSGFGLKLDDAPAAGGGGVEAIITAVTKDSPNRNAVHIGDRLVAIDGEAVSGGHEGAAPKLLAAVSRHEGKVPCVVRRPALLVCPGCQKMACCAKCVGEGRLGWHAYECALYRALPPQAKQGETATLRLLLRYKVSTEPKVGEWPSASKEPVELLTSLQANAADVPPEQLLQLSKLTGVPAPVVSQIIFQVRTNACEISRGGKKVGCALSVLMGWHNHDCAPNAVARVAPGGAVTLTAEREVKEGDEVTICYVDPNAPYEERKRTLQAHYGFECRCAKCVGEQRKELKTRMQQRDQYMQAQRR